MFNKPMILIGRSSLGTTGKKIQLMIAESGKSVQHLVTDMSTWALQQDSLLHL